MKNNSNSMGRVLPAWYRTRREDEVFVAVLTRRDGDGIRAGLISGPPGVGKTALGRALAEALGWELFYFLAHHWASEEDLFVKLDPARVAGIAGGVEIPIEDAYRPGVLLRGILASHRDGAVVLLDEWDKAPQRCDALLLEFLQAGRVYGPFGEVWEANKGRMVVVLTDNGMRPLAEPLLRRVFRLSMGFLPPQEEADLLRKSTGAHVGAIRLVVYMMNRLRSEGKSSPSLQEGRQLLECLPLCRGAEDVATLIRGYIVKVPEEWDVLCSALGADPGAVLWGEWRRGR